MSADLAEPLESLLFFPARHAAGLLILGLAATSPASALEPAPQVEISAPRDYGYVMGDSVEHTIRVTVPESYTLETGFLPQPGALEDWLELRSVDWDRNLSGSEARYRIRVAYQLFKGVRTPEKAVVPELPIRFAGPEPLEVKAPAWKFTVVPLIPPELSDDKVAIRAALPPEPAATATHRHRLWMYLAGALAVSGWLARQRLGWKDSARPFARARRELKKLLRGPASPETFRAAATLIHRALDETAGGTLFAGRIDRFCQSHPAFAELREELAGFFALSQRLFFTSPEAPVPADYPITRLEDFCRRCAAAERRTP